MTSPCEQQLYMLNDCENQESLLSDWERGFIASIGEQLDAGRSLTDKQEETLTRIWDKIT